MSESQHRPKRYTHTKNSRSLFSTSSYFADPELISSLFNDSSLCPLQSSNVSAKEHTNVQRKRRNSMSLFLDKYAKLKNENFKLKEKLEELHLKEEDRVSRNTQYLQDYLLEQNYKKNKLKEELVKMEESVHVMKQINTSNCQITLVNQRKQLISKLSSLNGSLKNVQSSYLSEIEKEILNEQIQQIENTQTLLLNHKLRIEEELEMARNNEEVKREEEAKKQSLQTLKEMKFVRHLANVIFYKEKDESASFFDCTEETDARDVGQIVNQMKDELQLLKEMVFKIIYNKNE